MEERKKEKRREIGEYLDVGLEVRAAHVPIKANSAIAVCIESNCFGLGYVFDSVY
jgi:hypothetical protein